MKNNNKAPTGKGKAEKPELSDGHGRIANEIMDALACTYMSSYESQFIWYLFRKTYGWNKKDDNIALSQISAGTGMHRSHVSRTKKKLLHRKIVTQTGNKIAFNKYHSQWVRLPKQATLPKRVTRKGGTRSGNRVVPEQVNQVVPEQAHTKETIKDTITKAMPIGENAVRPTPKKYAELFFARDPITMKAEAEYFIGKGVPVEVCRQEFLKFCSYWTELNGSGKKQLWQTKKTFEIRRRLVTWLGNTARDAQKKGGAISMPDFRTPTAP